MAKLVEVKEHQSITYNPEFKEDSDLCYLAEKSFEELERFILEFNEEESNEADAIDFLKIGVRRNVGKVIQAKNYVGLIQTKSGTQIQILPKISYATDEETKKIFLMMLRSMKDFPGKVFNDATLKMDKMNLYELFINMYIQEVQGLIKKGLRAAYLETEDNLRFYKGKIEVVDHIKQNAAHRERFYVRYDEFSINRAENKLIKATLLKLQKLSTSTTNIRAIRQLLSHFEMVELSLHHTKDFAKVSIDRTTKQYESLMSWSKVFLMNKSFSTFSGNTTARALLFPMEKVFEAYVARNLKKKVCELGWGLSVQDRSYHLFDRPKKFALRPDLVITKEDGTKVVLDTKWKRLIADESKNYGISQMDMYQMYAYSKKYGTTDIWVLYPEYEEVSHLKNIGFESDDGVKVHISFVDVVSIEESLERVVEGIKS